jgi:Sec7-like guanine-nucleotide exchange factor
MRYGVAIRVDGIAFFIVDEIAFIIALLNRGHDDDTIAVLYSFIVLFHFKEIRTE